MTQIPLKVRFKTCPCRWTMISREGEPDRFRHTYVNRVKGKILDAWKIRAQFLEVQSDPRSVLSFLNRTGLFVSHSGTVPKSRRDFCQWQGLVKKLLTRDPKRWGEFKHRYSSERLDLVSSNTLPRVTFRLEEGDRYAAVLTKGTLRGVLATIFLDHLRGARFRICARLGCTRVYEVTTGHKRKYCSPRCAHFDSVRRLRKRKRTGRRINITR